MSKRKQIKKLAEQVKRLVELPLYEFRVRNNYKPVIGEGNLDAGVVVTLGKTAREFAFEQFGVAVEYEKFSAVLGSSFSITAGCKKLVFLP